MNKTKVLHLSKEYTGNQLFRNSFILGLDPERYDVKTCYISGKPDGRNVLDQHGKSIYLGIDDLRKSKLRALLSLRKVLRKERPEILHCHRHRAAVCGVLASLFLRDAKIVLHVHGTNRTRTLGRKIKIWLLSKKISRIICVSEGVRDDVIRRYWGISEKQVVAIPNGLDYERFIINRPKGEARKTISDGLEDKFLIGVVGRLVQKKNHMRLIEAFQKVINVNPGIYLIIVGEGPLKNSLMEKVNSLKIGKNVIFTGFRSDVPLILNALDAFVLPSLPGEGLPLALLEAMGSGLPVIASKIPGIIEIFNETNMGYLIDPLNIQEMAEKILDISKLSGPELREMGLNAQKRAFSDYNSELMVKKISSLYETLTR